MNGRDSADLIIKEDEVLIRAGKHKKFGTGEIPVADDTRSFLQLSKYYSKTNSDITSSWSITNSQGGNIAIKRY